MTAPSKEELEIEGFWIDPKLALPARAHGDHIESRDVLIYLRIGMIYRFTVGHYNYIRLEWITDLGRYPVIEAWAHIPKVDQR